MSMEVLVPVAGILAVFAAMLVVLKIMRSKGLSFTARVFTALGLGVLLGLGIQLLLGRDGDAATTALDWISIVGQGYIGLLKMLVMPLVFVAIVGAFTRAEVTEHFGRIAFAVLAVLLGTVTVAAVLGWGATVLTGLAHAGFLDAATPDAAELSSPPSRARLPALRCRRKSSRSSRRTPSPTSLVPDPPPPSRSSSSRPSSASHISGCAIKTLTRQTSSRASSTACTASSCG